MKKKCLFIMVFILIILGNLYYTDACSLANIKLIDSEKVVYDNFFQVMAEIEISDSLNSEECLFSYHIYHQEELVRFDNVRMPITKAPNGLLIANINVDLNDEMFDKYEELTIQFDIVDMQNLIWISQMPGFESTEIKFKNMKKLDILEFLRVQFQRYTVEIIVNAIICILFWGSIIVCYNKEKNNL